MAAAPGAQLMRLALEHQALLFGDFTLKSGRPSPYFVNFAKLASARAAAALGRLFAARALQVATEATLLGVAYKGISLAALACAFAPELHPGCAYQFAYLRKEAKMHGEGDVLAGDINPSAALIVVDDVLTAATAAQQALAQLAARGARPDALLVGFDRGERISDASPQSAAAALAAKGLAVASIAGIDDLLAVADAAQAAKVRAHLARYGSA